MKKKFLAAVLSMSMVMGMALTANAAVAEGDSIAPNTAGMYEGTAVTAESKVELPVIRIELPTATPDIILNPYKMTVEDGSGADVDYAVISAPQEIKSSSNVPVKVNVEVSAAKADTTSNVIIAAAPLTKDITTKTIFLYMEAVNGSGTNGDEYTFSAVYDKSKTSQMIIGPKAATKAGIIQMPAVADPTADVVSAAYKISGAMVSEPATTPWTLKDKVKVTYKFTFFPATAAITP